MSDRTEGGNLTRRDFLRSATAAGAGMAISQVARSQESGGSEEQLNVALIGAGDQGRTRLMQDAMKIPGIRFKAVCDIWNYNREFATKTLQAYGHDARSYIDYQEMLSSEDDLDAVIIATPDWVHEEQTRDCLDAGLHVYCEKEMSNTLEGARNIVLAAKDSDKLVQIGHQRRSSPRFYHAYNMIHEAGMLGRITHARGQWNRASIINRTTPKKWVMDMQRLEKYGYGTMHRLRNWRWFKKFAGGPMCDLGSHHIDIFNWFLRSKPSAVQANGGLDFWGNNTNREWWDTVLASYIYETEQGPVRTFYQVANTTSYRGYYTSYMGFEGSLLISEQTGKGYVMREQRAKRRDWEALAKKKKEQGETVIELELGKTPSPERRKLEQQAKKPPHQPHLENFFAAIRGEEELNCPPELGYETAVCVFKANEAVRTGDTMKFDSSEFEV